MASALRYMLRVELVCEAQKALPVFRGASQSVSRQLSCARPPRGTSCCWRLGLFSLLTPGPFGVSGAPSSASKDKRDLTDGGAEEPDMPHSQQAPPLKEGLGRSAAGDRTSFGFVGRGLPASRSAPTHELAACDPCREQAMSDKIDSLFCVKHTGNESGAG